LTLVVAFLVQAIILWAQHVTALLPYPASTALWYIGSLLPGAWIGLSWERFKASPWHVFLVLGLCSLVGGYLFVGSQLGGLVGIHVPGAWENFGLALYASCASILVLLWCVPLVRSSLARPMEFLGRSSLQVYLIHPMVMVLLARPSVVRVLNPTFVGPLLSAVLLLAITFAIIFGLRVLRLERVLFGR
jgi:membrane-bound acyltransferase YfiQ involved in biofilm formation